MLRFWRRPSGARGEAPVPLMRGDQLSPRLLKDLNLGEEAGFLSPDSIRIRKLPRDT